MILKIKILIDIIIGFILIKATPPRVSGGYLIFIINIKIINCLNHQMIVELRAAPESRAVVFLFIKKLSEAKPLTRLGEKRAIIF